MSSNNTSTNSGKANSGNSGKANSGNSGKANSGNSGKSTTGKAMNKYNQSSTTTKVIIWIVIILIIVLLIWWIVYAVRKKSQTSTQNPVIIDSTIDAWVTRPEVSLPMPSSGYNYSYSMWIYVRDWDYRFGKWKNIMWKGNRTAPRHSPSIWLYPLTNSIKVVTSTTGSNGVSSCDVENIPLQKWVNIVYVLNNRSVDVYINGKLERTCILEGIPVNLKNDKLTINYNSGFYGKMGKFQYYTSTLSPEQIAKIYMSGPSGATGITGNLFSNGQINESDRTSSS